MDGDGNDKRGAKHEWREGDKDIEGVKGGDCSKTALHKQPSSGLIFSPSPPPAVIALATRETL